MVMSEILPSLYVGALIDSIDPIQMKKVTHIVRINHKDPTLLPRDYESKHTYHFVTVSDSSEADIRQFFSDVNDFVHEARMQGGTVLIHCTAGISRSVTVATAYVMSVTQHDLRDVRYLIKLARSRANPNDGFRRQLEEFEKDGGLQRERERLRPQMYHDHMFALRRLAVVGRWARMIGGLLLVVRERKLTEYEVENNMLTHVVRIGTGLDELAPKSSITYHFVECPHDESPSDFLLREHLPAVNDFIFNAHATSKKKGAIVAINCTSGPMARGAALSMGYLLSMHSDLGVDELLEYARKRHSDCIKDDTMELLEQYLHAFEKEGLQEERERLKSEYSSTECAARLQAARKLIEEIESTIYVMKHEEKRG